MKKIILSIVILASTTFALNGQTYGIKGGWSLSNLSSNGADIEDRNARNGFAAGVFANFPVGVFSIQPEVLYTQKGATFRDPIMDIESRTDYLDIPLSLQLNLLDPFYVYAGPQLSYLVNSEIEFGTENNTVVVDEDESNFNRFDLGAVAGAGFKFKNVFIDARVSRGYFDIDRDRTVDGVVLEAKNLQNFNFQLTTGIIF